MNATTALLDHTEVRPARPARTITRTRRNDVAAVPAAINSEWIKLRSLRSNRAIFAFAILFGVVMSWILAKLVKTDPYGHKAFTVAGSFMVSTWLTTVLAVIVGILAFTSEVQHGTISQSIAAQPARFVSVCGKAVVVAGFGMAMGAVSMGAGFGGAVVSGLRMGNTSHIAATVGWSLLLTTLAGVLGLGLGMIIRHSS
ncbi:MAG: ABC transporter permease, partial [Actinomycetota bacterium]